MSIKPPVERGPLTLLEEALYPNRDQIEMDEIIPGSSIDESLREYEFRQSTLSSLKTIPEDKPLEPPPRKKKKLPVNTARFSNPTPAMQKKRKKLFI